MAAGEQAGARVPPHSAEAEQAVLGALLMDNGAFDSVGDVLAPEDFYFADYRAIYATARGLILAGKPADVITVHDAGGHEFAALNELVMSVPSVQGARRWAEVVRVHSIRRQVVRVCMATAEAAMVQTEQAAPTVELISKACEEMLGLQDGAAKREPRLLSDLMPGWIDALNARAAGESDAVSTGLAGIDDIVSGGFRPGELVVLAARPSMGKSALALGIARHVAATRPVAVLTMEDSEQMLISRQVAAAGRWNLADLRRPDKARDGMWAAVAEAADKLGKLRLYVDDTPALGLVDVRTKALQVKRRAGQLGMVMVDYLQLMEGEGETRAHELTKIVRGMKKLAKELRCPVVLLCQLSRKADETKAPPRMDHLAESGGIEQAADVIGLLWRRFRVDPRPECKHDAQIEFVKNKNDPTDTARLWFDGATQRFEDATDGQD